METVLTGPAALISNPIRPLKRAEYDKLVAEGYFADEKVELLFGMVVEMSPVDPAHCESTRRLDELLRARLGGRARVSSQHPFAATDDSEPEPDVYVFPLGDYWHDHPDRAFLVVEVARSSLRQDRGVKAPLYALSQVDEYWIVNHVDGVVEVYRDRVDGRWQSVTTHSRGDHIAMLAFPDVRIEVADILPPV
jgi:Uma2 family endonuclease